MRATPPTLSEADVRVAELSGALEAKTAALQEAEARAKAAESEKRDFERRLAHIVAQSRVLNLSELQSGVMRGSRGRFQQQEAAMASADHRRRGLERLQLAAMARAARPTPTTILQTLQLLAWARARALEEPHFYGWALVRVGVSRFVVEVEEH